ncbi:MAG: RecX family transcriptional regulator [Caldilineaceae bacterium]
METRTITRLQIQKKNKERVNVFLDDEYAFSLDLMLAMGLKKGQALSTAEIATLQCEDEGKRAYAAALRFLSERARSRTEVEERLQRRGFAEAAIGSTVKRLQREGYLSDADFGRLWVENRQRFRPRSTRALRYELRQKGVAADVIEEVLDHAEIDEDEAAWAAVQDKLYRWETLDYNPFRQKVSGFLARRGFGHEVTRRAVERAWAQSQQVTEEQS